MRAESGLTHSQIPIWIGQALNRASPLYNMAFAFVLDGGIDTTAFCTAWRRIVAASDALRTSIDDGGAIGRRRVRPDGGETRLLDFADRVQPDEEFRAWARDRCTHALALDGALVDSVLVKLADRRYGWYLNQHHAVTDASSTVLLFRQVAAEYAAIAAPPGSTACLRWSSTTRPHSLSKRFPIRVHEARRHSTGSNGSAPIG